ncbi:MAG: Asp-tRNA(Asn)/Glu-tRNA(Gln) amidotransferase subunit GatB [bacterium]
MQLEAVIGLEIHVQLKTKSKMFCSCPNIFGDVEPNSAICPICLGYPGTLPVPNIQAIEWTQLAGAALGCDLAKTSKFDRKSYFYPDLPKGYQISQYDQPFCGRGLLLDVGITRIHLEEDAAKNIHTPKANYTLVDYNRAGTPLMEIVTEPDINSPSQAKAFLQELQRITRTLEISAADMEKGQLRCDTNISLREQGSKKLNPKTEIKNLNSFRNVERALKYEIKRQTKLFQDNKIPDQQSTRGFNADTGKTTEQRSKEEAADYRYFPEPDIPPFVFTSKYLEQIKIDLPELPHDKRERLLRQHDISRQHARLLADSPALADFFENTASELQQLDNEQTDIDPKDLKSLVKTAANVILRYRPGRKITPVNFAEVIVLLHQGRMNKNALSPVLAEMQKTGGDPDHILQNLGLEQVSNKNDLEKIIQEVINENEEVVAKVKAGKKSALQFLVGQVMQKTKGKANPGLVINILKKQISNW